MNSKMNECVCLLILPDLGQVTPTCSLYLHLVLLCSPHNASLTLLHFLCFVTLLITQKQLLRFMTWKLYYQLFTSSLCSPCSNTTFLINTALSLCLCMHSKYCAHSSCDMSSTKRHEHYLVTSLSIHLFHSNYFITSIFIMDAHSMLSTLYFSASVHWTRLI